MTNRPPLTSDKDFTDDPWSNVVEAPGSQNQAFNQQPQSYYRPNQLSRMGQPPSNSPYAAQGLQPNNQLQGMPTGIETFKNYLTPEDTLFMRSWQRDSYIFRVLPLTAVSIGALYAYNVQKSLPHTFGRYSVVVIAAYFLGKASYAGEFKRRLAQSQSNTPYMNTLRAKLGIPQPMLTDGISGDMGYGLISGNDSTNWDAPVLSGGFTSSSPSMGGYRQPGGFSAQPIQGTSYQPNFGNDNQVGFEEPKQGTTYDELRAKNRGLIR